MDLLRSKLGANFERFFLYPFFFFPPWIPNFKKDVICFSWLQFGEKSVTLALAAADIDGHTGNVCSLQFGRPVERTPGNLKNKTAAVQAGE